MRERLRPYIRQCMEEAHEVGAPVMRPMFYEFPEDSQCWNLEDQYMFGPDLIVAPVMEEGMVERSVYLPKELTWMDAKSKVIYQGGQSVMVKTPLDVIPVFIREGKQYEIYID